MTGTTKIIRTSTDLPWHGFTVTEQLFFPEAGPGSSIDRQNCHVIGMLCSISSLKERTKLDGRYVCYTRTAGEITILPGEPPMSYLNSPSHQLFCSLDPQFIDSVANERDGRAPSQPGYRAMEHDRQTAQILKLLSSEIKTGGVSGRLYAESLAIALASRFLMLVTNDDATELRSLTFQARALARVKELIESSLAENLSVNALAQESGFSREHFLRLFKNSTGMTPHKYIVQARINRAKELLRGSTSLSDIAALSGFCGQSHMTLLFRRYGGATPAEFRRNIN